MISARIEIAVSRGLRADVQAARAGDALERRLVDSLFEQPLAAPLLFLREPSAPM